MPSHSASAKVPNLKIRLATEEDVDTLVQLAEDFYHESPYSNYVQFSQRRVKEVIRSCLLSPLGVVIVLESDTRPVGMLVAAASTNIFSEDLLAQEVAWFVDPQYRGRESLHMVEAYEEWARVIGCKLVALAHIPEVTNLDRLYKRLGYNPMEQAYIKDSF